MPRRKRIGRGGAARPVVYSLDMTSSAPIAPRRSRPATAAALPARAVRIAVPAALASSPRPGRLLRGLPQALRRRLHHTPSRHARERHLRATRGRQGDLRERRRFDVGRRGQRPIEFLVGKTCSRPARRAKHKRERKLMMPAVHGDRMVSYGTQMRAITDEVVSRSRAATWSTCRTPCRRSPCASSSIGFRFAARRTAVPSRRVLVEFLSLAMNPDGHDRGHPRERRSLSRLSGEQVGAGHRPLRSVRRDDRSPSLGAHRANVRDAGRDPLRRDCRSAKSRLRTQRRDVHAHAGGRRRRAGALGRRAARRDDGALHRRSRDHGHDARLVAGAFARAPTRSRCRSRGVRSRVYRRLRPGADPRAQIHRGGDERSAAPLPGGERRRPSSQAARHDCRPCAPRRRARFAEHSTISNEIPRCGPIRSSSIRRASSTRNPAPRSGFLSAGAFAPVSEWRFRFTR